jgi:DNA-directed RNA polymerase specialized sigma24 family protein
MKKITIRDIEKAILNQVEIKPNEDTDHRDFENNLNDKLELELAIKKLSSGDQEIIQMILGGFTYREIQDELGIGGDRISGAKKALYGKIK